MFLSHNWLIIWEVLIFAGLIALLRAYAWKPVLNSLASREESIRLSIQKAKEAENESEKILEENKKSVRGIGETMQKTIMEARTVAYQMRSESTASASSEAAKILKRTGEEIERMKTLAISQIHVSLAEDVVRFTEALLIEMIDESRQKKLVDESLYQMGRSRKPMSENEQN